MQTLQRFTYECPLCGWREHRDLEDGAAMTPSIELAHTYGPRVAPEGNKKTAKLTSLYCSQVRLRWVRD